MQVSLTEPHIRPILNQSAKCSQIRAISKRGFGLASEIPAMSIVIKVLGVALVIVGVAFPIWRLMAEKGKPNQPRQRSAVAVSILAVFAGLALILADRITEFTVRGVGTIHVVTEQAIIDAKTVADIKTQVESIKTRVENGSATVDLVASQASKAKEMSELVASQTKEAGQKLETLDTAIKEADVALQKLRDEEEFQTTILAAQNDDRVSFDRLKTIANDKDSRFSDLAGRAWNTIFDAHSNPMSLSGFTVPWNPAVDPSKLSLVELSAVYKSAQSPLKPALLEYIWKRDDVPKILRLDFMLDVMKTDSSLTGAEYAGRYFTQGTDQKIKAMALDYLSQWWDAHRQEFVGK
jgi:hypothetical protein